MSNRRIVWLLVAAAAVALTALGVARFAAGGDTNSVHKWHPNKHAIAAALRKKDKLEGGGEKNGPAQEQYMNRALPHKYVAFPQVQNAIKVFSAESVKFVKQHPPAWQELGPFSPFVPGSATYTGRSTKVSGRVTALAISPVCFPGNCALYVGAAGGGVWKTNDVLAPVPVWAPKTDKMPTTAIGSVVVDPNHPNIVYAGTGEESGSGDSEAGLGLYKSTDGGDTWGLIPSTVPLAADRSIGAIAIDPANTSHLLMGTDLGLHGVTSVGGSSVPPDAPPLALYESFNAGTTWNKVLELPGGPGFSLAGGISKVAFDQTGHGNEYASIFGYGLWRNKGSGWQQIFHPLDQNDGDERTEFALSKWNNGATRIYVGSGDIAPAELFRVNDDRNPAAALLASQDNPQGGDQSWKDLSSPNYGDAGYTSYDFCQGQCFYDMGVATPQSGLPSNLVVLSGSMRYGDIFGYAPPVSNGATVIRSTNSGDYFADLTNDTLDPPNGLHPDSREVAFDPNDPRIMFLPSDGGVVRVGPTYVNATSDCDGRGLTDAQKKTCKFYLSAIPDQLDPINGGLRTLQFQSVTINKQNPGGDLIGGTQDNGTWAFDCTDGPPCNTFESINGDGGQSAIDATKPSTRTHSYYLPQYDTNFHGNYSLGWDWISDPLIISYLNGETWAFYPPLINDPVKHGYEFTGGQYVWRTQDNGGPQAYLDQHCNEYFGDFQAFCGDWVKMSPNLTVGAADPFSKGGAYISAVERAPNDTQTMWVGLRRGRVYVTKNALDAPSAVKYDRIDTPDQPFRIVSGITIDPYDSNHAFVSFSGYAAYTPGQPGHVFEVFYHPLTHNATWKNLTYDIGDQPVTDIELIQATGDLYVSTDFGVLELPFGQQHWFNSGTAMPQVPVYSLRQIDNSGWLYAATHGRGVYRLPVPRIP
jgi:hypothetical protein